MELDILTELFSILSQSLAIGGSVLWYTLHVGHAFWVAEAVLRLLPNNCTPLYDFGDVHKSDFSRFQSTSR
jgi:hypothetical protein